jgi:hypothetical protein
LKVDLPARRAGQQRREDRRDDDGDGQLLRVLERCQEVFKLYLLGQDVDCERADREADADLDEASYDCTS